MEPESKRRKDELQALREVWCEAACERRAIDDERLKRLAFLLDSRRLNPDLAAVHGQCLPSLPLLDLLVFIWINVRV